MVKFNRSIWRVLLVWFCTVIAMTSNTAMALQMTVSACHTMPMTSMNEDDQMMDHSCISVSAEKNKFNKVSHDKACMGQSCCFCLSEHQANSTSVYQVFMPISSQLPPYAAQHAAGYFSSLYRPPKYTA